MTEVTKKRRPFGALRVDPKRAQDGVWIQHPEMADQLLVRRLWCAEHIRAHEQATQDYERQHGTGSAQSEDGQRHVYAVGMATGLIIGWKVDGDPDRPYDAAEMTALLLDPEYADLRPWITFQAGSRRNFQPAALAGN
jgi:hypothetical protein